MNGYIKTAAEHNLVSFVGILGYKDCFSYLHHLLLAAFVASVGGAGVGAKD